MRIGRSLRSTSRSSRFQSFQPSKALSVALNSPAAAASRSRSCLRFLATSGARWGPIRFFRRAPFTVVIASDAARSTMKNETIAITCVPRTVL